MGPHTSIIQTLSASHDALAAAVAAAGPVTGASYCSDWSIAQVLSHIGSGAEIGLLNVSAALAKEPAPERERYLAIWDVWNAKTPETQVADALVADAKYIELLSGLDDASLDELRVPMMGRELDASGAVAMRLFEHAIHTWDVSVMRDDSAEVLAAATEVLVDRLPDRIARSAKGAKPTATPSRLGVTTVAPDRTFALAIGEDETAIDQGPASDGTLAIPAGALLRLVSGRLDPAHTPSSVSVSGSVSLDELRALFDQS